MKGSTFNYKLNDCRCMALIKCKKCGKEISDSVKTCIHCGSPIVKMIKCSDCNKEYEESLNACPNCGKKNGKALLNKINKNASDVLEKASSSVKSIDKKKLIPVGGGIAGVVILTIILVSIFVVGPNIKYKKFLELIDQNNYKEAYNYASKEEDKETAINVALAEGDYEFAYENTDSKSKKEEILMENLLASFSYNISDGLKNPSSFKLHHAWRNDNKKIIIVEYEGTNSYGGVVSGYIYYSFDEDDREYQRYTSFNDFEEEKTYSWDSSSEKIEKILKNACKTIAKKIVRDDDLKLSDKFVDRINKQFSRSGLKDVTLLKEVSKLYPETDNGNSV